MGGHAVAVVTATGIVQARCGQPTSPGACGAWRLSGPGGDTWRPCYSCGSTAPPAPVEAAGAEAVAQAVAAASAPTPPPPA